MLMGEHESSKMIYSVMPDFIPTPYGYGHYKAEGSDAYFYLSQFIDMDVTSAPDPEDLMGRLAELHKNSQSPTGKFGFPVATYDGNVPHLVSWEAKWVDFFRNLFLNACSLDAETNEPWPEMELAVRQMGSAVIPRLLGNLRQSGTDEPVKPCLIHGDLWEGNRGIDLETGDSCVYDASSYFAHNEMEFGNWRSELCATPSLAFLLWRKTRWAALRTNAHLGTPSFAPRPIWRSISGISQLRNPSTSSMTETDSIASR